MVNSTHFFVNIWITFNCNFRCRYCYVNTGCEHSNMKQDVADQVINFIKKNIKPDQELVINFHGGEPIINFEMVKYIVDKCESVFQNKVSFGITTNASLLDDYKINYLAEKFNYNLSVSIDGDKETHIHNRIANNPEDTYIKIMQNADNLLEKNLHTRIRMTFDRENVDKLFTNVKLFIDKGYKYIVPAPDIFSMNWSEEDLERLEEQLRKIKEYIQDKDIKINLVSEELQCLSTCTAGNDYYSIDPEGNIYPCTFLVGKTEMIIGDCINGINSDSLDKINNLLEKKVESCSKCAVNDKCLGARCIFTNYVTMGDFYTPNLVECNMMYLRLKVNGYI